MLNAVLVPSNKGIPTQDVVQLAASTPSLSTLTSLLIATGLNNTLSLGASSNSFTVLAPIDSGWSGVPASVSSYTPALSFVLTYHVLEGRVYSTDLPLGINTTKLTLAAEELTFLRTATGVTVYDVSGGSAVVTLPDQDSSK